MSKNIQDFKNYKKIHKLSKPRSPIIIEFMTDDIDQWIITILRYKRRSGEIVENFMILEKELDKWISIYNKDGWTLTLN